MANILSPVVLLVLLFLFVAACPSVIIGQADSKPEKQMINVHEIGRSVTLVGRLGRPLGTKVEIRGTWSLPTELVKDDSPRLTVTHVDRKRLDEPLQLNIKQIRAMTPGSNDYSVAGHENAFAAYKDISSLSGEVWTMIAYETGSIKLIPDEYKEEEPVFPMLALPQYEGPFVSEIVAVVISKTSDHK